MISSVSAFYTNVGKHDIQGRNARRTLSKSSRPVHAFEAPVRIVLGEACPLFFVVLIAHVFLLYMFSSPFSLWKIAPFGNSLTVSRKSAASPNGTEKARVVS